MKKHKGINTYTDRAMMESSVEKAHINKEKLSIVLFKYEISLDNAFFYKDIIKEIYQVCDYSTIFYLDNDTFAFMVNKNLHDTIVLFRKIQRRIKNIYKEDITKAGITELSTEDTYNTFLQRGMKYFKISVRISKGIIIYGTHKFDFYDEKRHKDMIEVILKNNNKINICNLHNGVVFKEKGVILLYNQKVTTILTTKEEIAYLLKYEKYVYLQHKDIPYTIKADIAKIDPVQNKLWVKNYLFLETSPIDRTKTRIEPKINNIATILHFNKILFSLKIISLSSESISATIDKTKAKKLKSIDNKNYTIRLKIINFSSINNNVLNTSAIDIKSVLFFISADSQTAVFTFRKNPKIQSKIEAHIDYIRKSKIEPNYTN